MSVLVESPQTTFTEEPAEITLDVVQYWCKHTKTLKKSQISKSKKFIKYNCLHYIGYDSEFNSSSTFVCLPLNTAEKVEVNGKILLKIPYPQDYNFSVYKMYKDENGDFCCNCQGFQTKLKRGETPTCSHTGALYMAFRLKLFRKSK